MENLDTAAPTDPERDEQWPGDTGEGKPAYTGVWLDMTPSQQSAYMRARKAWKASHETDEVGEKRSDDSTGMAPAAFPPDSPAARLHHEMLTAPLPSDRIRAADALARIERAELEHESDEVALWLARRDTLLTLPPQERLEWLLGVMRDEEQQGEDPAEDDEGSWLLPP